MNKYSERLYNGVIKENPTFVQMLGMCPTLAVTSTAINGLGMGLATTAVLTASNLMISALRKLIPDQVRIPAYITIIASFVTIISFLMQAYTPELYDSLGVFISLIVVNCIILGRAEAYASKNPVLPSVFDGIGMGLGFTLGLTVIGVIREFLGAGTIFGFTVTTKLWDPIKIFTANPGAFFVLAFIIAGINAFAIRKAKKTGEKPRLRRIDSCAGCTNLSCAGRRMSEAAGEENVTMKAAAAGAAMAGCNKAEGAAPGSKAAEGAATGSKAAEGATTGSKAAEGAATGSKAAEGAATGSKAAEGAATGSKAAEGATTGSKAAEEADGMTPAEKAIEDRKAAARAAAARIAAERAAAAKSQPAMQIPVKNRKKEGAAATDAGLPTDDKLVVDESDEEVENILSGKRSSGKKASWEGTVTLDMETGTVTSDMDVKTSSKKDAEEVKK